MVAKRSPLVDPVIDPCQDLFKGVAQIDEIFNLILEMTV